MNIKVSVKAYYQLPCKKERINVSKNSANSKKFEILKLQVRLFQLPIKQNQIIPLQKKLRFFSKEAIRKRLVEEYMADQD